MGVMQTLLELARFSSSDPEREGVTRLPFSAEQIEAARCLQRRMEALGMETAVDPCGTVSGVLRGTSEETLVMGSHYDSVPNGGRFDGVAGVAVALDVVERLRNRGELPFYTLQVLALNDEDGVRFSEGFLSSRTVCGLLEKTDYDRITDRATGVPVREFLENAAFQDAAIHLPNNTRAYLEFHVEQGPVLDRKKLPLAVVDRIVGVYHCFYTFAGIQNHAGSTPMEGRKDPVPAFGEMAARLPEIGRAHPNGVATIGYAELEPNVPNVIPRSVRFSVDLRHGDAAEFAALQRETDQLAEEIARRYGLEMMKETSTDAQPVSMDSTLRKRLGKCIRVCGLPEYHMDSGAGHDAQIFALKVPSVMLFAASVNGASHCKEELTREEHLKNAAEVLYQFVKEPF